MFVGWGLFYLRSDIVKIVLYLVWDSWFGDILNVEEFKGVL